MIAACRASSPELDALNIDRVTLDLASEISIADCRSKIEGLTSGLDVIIHNAGVPNSGTWSDSEGFGTLRQDAILQVLSVNAVGPLLLTQALMPLLRGERPVVASVTSSFSSLTLRDPFFANNFAYSASKVSLNMFMRSLAILLKEQGILTVSLDPGWVRTRMGGPEAPTLPEDSVAGMLKIIDELSSERSGGYFGFWGEPVPW